MTDPGEALGQLVAVAAQAIGVEPPQVSRSTRADYQLNTKRMGDAVAEQIVAALPANDLIERVSVKSGFASFTLRDAWLVAAVTRALADDRLGVPLAEPQERVVIDYSSPNVAKEMHAGHLRSTIIGDALARVLAFRGHDVIRQNHLGDWGTPIGMLYEHDRNRVGLTIERIGELYREANARFKADPEFAERAKRRVVTLQSGIDEDTRAWWQTFVDLSIEYMESLYAALGVLLERDDIRGESFYNDRLGPLVDELLASGAATMIDGAVGIALDGFVTEEGEPKPLVLRKSDGGHGYGATDLAAIRYRLTELGGTRLLYVVGASQAQHLAMVFRAAKKLGWLPSSETSPSAEHVGFGLVLDPKTGKRLASRDGASIRLADLIRDAIARADAEILKVEADRRDLAETNGWAIPEPMPAELRAEIARKVGIGSIKYADLSCERIKDYKFDLNRMVTFRGDAAGSLQMAHARVRGIVREVGEPLGAVAITHPAERALVLRLLQFGDAVRAVEDTLEPARLCSYLYDVSVAFGEMYQKCRVREAEPATRASRLALVELTGRTLARGLDLLGISAPDRM